MALEETKSHEDYSPHGYINFIITRKPWGTQCPWPPEKTERHVKDEPPTGGPRHIAPRRNADNCMKIVLNFIFFTPTHLL